jgi:quinol monooxygenase YgiN
VAIVLADDTSNRASIATLSEILVPKHPMPYVLIIHEVEDYPAWKQIFDAAADLRRDAGEREYQVLKYTNNPNQIVHFSSWTSLADARRFFESPQLVQIRAAAGVKSPEFIYLEQLESGSLGG